MGAKHCMGSKRYSG